jgi:CubicO group peptidase (beta-lactamase class C family)
MVAIAATSPAAALPADFKAKADAYLKSAYPADGPGAAVIVTDDGKVVYAAGQGLADVQKQVPITPGTVFRIGSITKQFSAAVILQLAKEGKLSLEDPVSKYLPDYPKPGADATIAQLLNHTVGVQSYTDIPGWMVEAKTSRPYTTDEMIAEFKDKPAPSRPGEKWAYNNSGYVLVGAVIEKVTGKPWHQAVQERIARPLGLKTIRYGVEEPSIAQMASGYTSGEKGPQLAQKIHMSVPHAAGALVGSVEDLATWANALHHGRVVSPDLYARMIAPTKLADGTENPYGFGIANQKIRDRKAIGHGGGIFGFATSSMYIPEDDLFVAVFTNSNDPATGPAVAAQQLAALAIGDPFPTFQQAKLDPASVEPMFGVYKLKEGERRFFARDGKFYTRRSGGSDLEVFPAGNGRFFYGPKSFSWFQMRRDASGAYGMDFHQDGAKEAESALRAGPIPPEPKLAAIPRATLARYIGSYKAAPGIALVGWGEGDVLTIKLGNGPPVALRPTSASEFDVQGVDARVAFKLEGDKVSGLLFRQGQREFPAERLPDGS